MALWFSGIRRALSWNPYFSERSARAPRSLKLPDLFAPLGEGASSEFEINRHCKQVTDASAAWFREQCQLSGASASASASSSASSSASASTSTSSSSSGKEEREAQELENIDLKAGLLAAICFPAVDFGQLRLCADFLNWMLHFECELAFLDTPDARKRVQAALLLAVDPACSAGSGEGTGRALKSILIRLQPKTSFFKRFSETLQAYLHVLDQQLQDREQHVVPDIESYIALQREGGWPRLLFLLLECSQGLSTSEIGWSKNRGLTQLTEAAADVLMYATDIVARTGCVKHLSQTSGHNTVTLLARQIQQQNQHQPQPPPQYQQPGRPRRDSSPRTATADLPLAVTQAGELYSARFREFLALKSSLLSPRKSLDFSRALGRVSLAGASDGKDGREEDAAAYARGLARCVAGVLFWSFESERYFGHQGPAVRLHRTVELSMIRS